MDRRTFSGSRALLLPVYLLALGVANSESKDINLGHEIKVGESWVSEQRIFAAGFKEDTVISNSKSGSDHDLRFNFAIWYVFDPQTVVWTAKSLENDEPLLVSRDATLLLTNDALVINQGSQSMWKTVIISCDQCISKARMSDTGSLMMLDAQDGVLWQSFDSPTNTLLPNQQLVGSMSLSVVSSKYKLELNPIQVMLRYKGYLTQPYWSITNSNLSITNISNLTILPRLNFSNDGVITFYDGTGNSWDNSLEDRSMIYALDYQSNDVLARRLTLDDEGNFCMYSMNRNSSSYAWTIVWKAVFTECDVFGACGEFGICSYTPLKTCTCPPGFHHIDKTDPTAGCAYDTPLHCNATNNKFVRLVRADYPWNDYNFDAKIVMPLEGCMESCLRDCNCLAAAYKYQGTDLCFHKGHDGKLFNGIQTAFLENFVLLKVASEAQVDGFFYSNNQNNNDAFITDTSAIVQVQETPLGNHTHHKKLNHALLGIAIGEGVLIVGIIIVLLAKTSYKK